MRFPLKMTAYLSPCFFTPVGSRQRGSRDSNFAVSSGDSGNNAYLSNGFGCVAFHSRAAAFQAKYAASRVETRAPPQASTTGHRGAMRDGRVSERKRGGV